MVGLHNLKIIAVKFYWLSRETLIKSFGGLRMDGKLLIPLVVSLSNHEWNQFVQRFPRRQSILF